MLTDKCAGGRERIVLADQAHGVGVAAVLDEHEVARDIHARGAQCHAGHRQGQACQTSVMLDMLDIVVPEALKAAQAQLRRVAADGAVRRVIYDPGGALDYG